MARDNFILKTLLETGIVEWNPKGNSMVPKITSGAKVIIKRFPSNIFRLGDIVYSKVKGNYYLHLISAIDGDRYQISNNKGFINGWIGAECIYGICIQVEDRVLLSDQDAEKRLK